MSFGPEYFLNQDAATARILAHARLLTKISNQYATFVPGALARASRVANYKLGKVVIYADNGAVAAKLRQMSQRLCDEFSKKGVECNEIAVKVQPSEIPLQSTTSSVKPLSAHAVETLQRTSGKLPEGPLRQALETLLARAIKQE